MSHQHTAMAGEYRIILNAGTPDEQDTGWFDNLITDIGLNEFATGGLEGLTGYCSVGTGTTTPANSDITLVQRVYTNVDANYASTAATTGSPNYDVVLTKQFSYPQGAVVGNLAEVGVGWTPLGTQLFSRARIVDGSNNPTVITVTSIDQLTIFYRLTLTQSKTDVTGSFSISGVTYNYTMRPATINQFFGRAAEGSPADLSRAYWYEATAALGPITGSPSGASEFAGSFAKQPYTSGTFKRDVVITLAPSQGNVTGGIGAIELVSGLGASSTAWPSVQIKLDQPIPKTNTKQLVWTVTATWGRA